MSPIDPCISSACAIAAGVRDGTLTAAQVLEAHLARIARIDPVLNAFTTLAADRARQDAEAIDRARAAGRTLGPLAGVPVGIKDLYDTAGIRTTYGSSFHKDHVPERDAETVRRLKAAGAVIVGKCATGELGTGSTTKNDWFGPTRNPWNPARVAGGSSGGSAAAVAAGLCGAATGSDAGGSVRGPAALCGAVGLMATKGRIPSRGGIAGAFHLSQGGVLARDCADAALLYGVLAGFDTLDPSTADRPVEDTLAGIEGGVAGLRVGLCPDLVPIALDRAVADGVVRAAAAFESRGATVREMRFAETARAERARTVISDAEKIQVERARFLAQPEGYGANLRARFERALRVTLDDYVQALRDRAIVRHAARALFAEVDLLLLPAFAAGACDIATETARIDGRPVPWEGLGIKLLGFGNLIGVPGIAIPAGLDAEGMPVAVQLLAAPWEEATLLRAARALERMPGFGYRAPPEPAPATAPSPARRPA